MAQMITYRPNWDAIGRLLDDIASETWFTGCVKRSVVAALVRILPNGKPCIERIAISGPPPGKVCTWEGIGKCTSCLHAEVRLVRGNLFEIYIGRLNYVVAVTRRPCEPCTKAVQDSHVPYLWVTARN